MSRYLELRCHLPSRLEDELPEVLGHFPVCGCLVEGGEDGQQVLRVYLDAVHGDLVPDIVAALSDRGAGPLATEVVADQDWMAAYRRRARPFAVGRRWWIDPRPQFAEDPPDGRDRLVVEPRSAFGSGSHESTRLVLQELESMQLEGRTVLDVGTGSGILALAADRLGSDWVLGLDIDPQALWVARQVAGQQDWDARPRFLVGGVGCLGGVRFDVILCNMIVAAFTPILVDLERVLAPGGTVVLSGILGEQREDVAEALKDTGLAPVGDSCLEGWLLIRAQRRPRTDAGQAGE